MPAIGEAAHRTGEIGAQRAKLWLEATTRVDKCWTNEDAVLADKLAFQWPFGGQPFSFDLGGIMSGAPVDGHFFMAEVKKYRKAQDQGTHYDDWVSKCYVVEASGSRMSDHFMWLTWAPFRADTWDELPTEASVRTGLMKPKNTARVFDKTPAEVDAAGLIDDAIVERVAKKIWIVVLSDKQEDLVVSTEHRSWIMSRQVLERQR